MPKTPPPAPATNRLLARLPSAEYQRLQPHMQPVRLEFEKVLYEARSPIDYTYFPDRGVVSVLNVMSDGSAIEVGNIGYEGAVGVIAVAGLKTSPSPS